MAYDAKREALVGRFRSGSIARIRQISLALIECEQGRGTREHVENVARELHTLKGESRMLGFGALSELAHAAEDRLERDAPDPVPGPVRSKRLLDTLAVMARFLANEANEEGLKRAQAELTAPLPVEDLLASGPASVYAAAASAAVPDDPDDTAGPVAEGALVPRAAGERWVQVSTGRIDALCEAVFGFASDFRALETRLRGRSNVGAQTGHDEASRIAEDFDRCRMSLEGAISAAWAMRLTPVDPVLEELARHGRDLALAQSKRVRFSIAAGGVQIERSTLDGLWEPLVHLLRNAIDHGVEKPSERGQKRSEACIDLVAEPVGTDVILSITDDGRGIDPERVRSTAVDRGLLDAAGAQALSDEDALDLLFRHGFSTREQASDLSGRGVGLDVVKKAVDALGGEIRVDSDLGFGTRFSLVVPATVSKERTLVFECDGACYGLPSRHVKEVVSLHDLVSNQVPGGRSVRYEGDAIPLRSLSATLGATSESAENRVLIVSSAGRRYAYAAAKLLGEFELIRRPVDPLLGSAGHVAASATLDDGSLVLILTLAGLLRRSGTLPAGRPLAPSAVARKRRVLVVDDSPIVRDLLNEVLSSAGLEVTLAPEGRAALRLIEAERPDAVLTDIDMPVMDGFELLRQIRSRSQELPVIILSTRGSETDRQAAAALGADAYVVKSELHETGLIETLSRYVGESA